MVSSTNKADCHYRTEILLKVALPLHCNVCLVFNATFNNILVILWSALFMEETAVSEENLKKIESSCLS
jgi:hypothetical protein